MSDEEAPEAPKGDADAWLFYGRHLERQASRASRAWARLDAVAVALEEVKARQPALAEEISAVLDLLRKDL